MIAMLEGILRRPKTVFVLMIALVVAGVATYVAIPKEDSPDIDVPVFYVSVTQQGISPEDAERLLVRPLETSLRSLDGLKEITAIASESHAGIILEFDISFDKDKALADVRDKVDQAKSDLPQEAEEPTIQETNFALLPTITVALSGDVPERTLYRHARRLKDQIEAIETVRSADLSGHREELLEVLIDSLKLESYAVSQQELLDSLTRNNQLVPAGFLDSGKGRFSVKVPGLVETAEDVYSLPIKQSGEGVVTLADVAEIRRTFKDPTSFTRVNGKPAIALKVTKRIGTNIIENNQAVRAVVEDATEDWPETINVDLMIDMSSNINETLGSLQSSILTAIFLVMVLVVAALGLKSALLIGLAIPTSFMIGFLILGGLGMTVNIMVMFGLVLTVGMLVDGAIVVVEYADRKIHEGMEQREAYIRAAKLMFWPIVSSTATTLVAFLPMLLWPGVAGEFMSYLPIMVIIVLSASLVTALVFLPVTGGIFAAVSSWTGRHAELLLATVFGGLAAGAAATAPQVGALLSSMLAPAAAISANYALATTAFLIVFALSYAILRPVVAHARARAAKHALEQQAQAQLLAGSEAFDPRKIKGATGLYVRSLQLLAGNVLGNVIVIVGVLVLCAGIFMAYSTHNSGVEFFVDEEPDQAIVLVSGRGNISTQEALELVLEVEREVLQVKGVANVVSSANSPGGGSGPQFIGGLQDKPADVIGELQMELADYCCRRKASEIFKEIRARTTDLAGIKVEVRKIEGGPPAGKDLQLEVKSTDYTTLVQTVARIRNHIDQDRTLIDIEDDRPLPGIEWQIEIDREQAGRYQAGIASVGSMVQLVTNGVLIGKYRPTDSDDEVDIRVRLPEAERTIDRFDGLRLQTPLGLVPIANFVERAPGQKVSSITRRDGLYSMMLKATIDPASGVLADEKVKELDSWLKAGAWPSGIFFKFRGADEDQKESGEFLVKAMIASLFLMFIILLTQFNSFYQTFLTLSTVVMSVMGVLLGMMITGQKFSIIMTGTGIVALAGIVVNNSIVLIDTYNRLREDGIPPLEAALKTSAQRIRPIMLTTVTTIAGLIPMATQVNLDFFNRLISVGSITAIWWIQLSTAVIAGLAFSTVLTLIVIPTMLALPSVWTGTARSVYNWSSRRLTAKPAIATVEPSANPKGAELVRLTPHIPSRPVTKSAELSEAAE